MRACDGHWIWSLAPRFLTTCRGCKWSSVLSCPFVGSFVVFQRQSGRCALCMEAQWLAVGAYFVATNPAPNDVDDAWLLCVEAIHPDLRLTFRRASSLTLSTGALSHTMWSGSFWGLLCFLAKRGAVYPVASGVCLTCLTHQVV